MPTTTGAVEFPASTAANSEAAAGDPIARAYSEKLAQIQADYLVRIQAIKSKMYTEYDVLLGNAMKAANVDDAVKLKARRDSMNNPGVPTVTDDAVYTKYKGQIEPLSDALVTAKATAHKTALAAYDTAIADVMKKGNLDKAVELKKQKGVISGLAPAGSTGAGGRGSGPDAAAFGKEKTGASATTISGQWTYMYHAYDNSYPQVTKCPVFKSDHTWKTLDSQGKGTWKIEKETLIMEDSDIRWKFPMNGIANGLARSESIYNKKTRKEITGYVELQMQGNEAPVPTFHGNSPTTTRRRHAIQY